MPLELSVIVPTYRRCVLVERLPRALSQQTLSPQTYEVIIVIGGSLNCLSWLDAQQALNENRRAGQGLTSLIRKAGV